MRIVRLAIGLGLVGCVACGLAFAPGDYAESGPASPAEDAAPAAPDAGMTEAGPSDAAAPSTRVLVFAGRRDAVPGEPSSVNVAETMRTTVSASGELGPWSFDVPPPQSTSWSRAVVVGEQLFLQSSNVFVAGELALATDSGLRPEWRALPPRSLPEGFMRAWIVPDAGLAVAGGSREGSFTTNVFVAPLADGGVEDWQLQTSKLVKARGDVTLLRHGDFLYALGGRDNGSSSASGRDEVEVARFAADGTLGQFVATTKLVNPGADAAAFGVFLPMVTVGAGHLFVLGGQTTASSGSMTDVALAAKIDATSGEIGPWLALPKLPAPMNSAAAVVAGDHVVVFGGNLGGASSDAVLALSIGPNGSFGTEWKKIGALPGARAGLAAVVY